MGKVVKFTGSKLLGAELRRLRGGRSLKQISELSKSPPLSERVAPISAPTLSQIENGISFPSLETIHSLAQLYKRPVQQLLDLVVQERLAESRANEADVEPSLSAFAGLAERGEWHGAYLMASVAERSSSGAESLRWRGNRAQALQALGFTHDCISLLEECLDHPDLPADEAHVFHQALATSLAHAGLYRSAVLHQEAALAAMPDNIPAKLRLHLMLSRAHLTLAIHEGASRADEREVREVVRQLESAATAVEEVSPELQATIRLIAAWGRKLQGNRPVARAELTELVSEAREAGMQRTLMDALAVLGTLDREAGRLATAIRELEEAAQVAVDLGANDSAFDLYFELYVATEAAEPGKAEYYLRRCERYYPLIDGRTPNMIRFESVSRGA